MVVLPIQVWFTQPRTQASALTWLNTNTTIYDTTNHDLIGSNPQFRIYEINERTERTFTFVHFDTFQDNGTINVLVGTLRKEKSG